MSKERKEEPQDHHDDDEFMKISDYSEGRSSEVDEYPFQQLQNILSPEESRHKKEQFYKEKIVDLQQKCNKLFKTASYLTKRIQDLQIQINDQTEIELDPTIVNQFLESLSQQIEKYKKDLDTYREKQLDKNKKQDRQLEDVKVKIDKLKTQNQYLQSKVRQIEDRNKELEQNNSNLLNEIQNLENELEDLKTLKKNQRFYKNYTRTKFDDEIQAELQVLIEKLMGQLQAERSNNKKAVVEMKSMQEELMNLQRQLTAKNNKIYSLEMKELRLNRRDNNSDKLSLQKNETSFKGKNKSQRYPAFKNITFQEYLEDSLDINEKERYIVASKIINLFIKKMEADDLDSLMEDQILLCSYSKENSNQITIKKAPNIQPSKQQTSPKLLAWNLSMLLSKLLIEPSYNSDCFDDSIKILTEALNKFIDEQNPSIQSFSSLKNLLDQIVKTTK